MIEITTFRLLPGRDESGFEAADRKVQTQFAYRQPGLVRRTVARGADGGWVVITVWRSEVEADAAGAGWAHDPLAAGFMAFVDGSTARTDRYATLD
jgi:heme-degrading monooxygenase HmoA